METEAILIGVTAIAGLMTMGILKIGSESGRLTK